MISVQSGGDSPPCWPVQLYAWADCFRVFVCHQHQVGHVTIVFHVLGQCASVHNVCTHFGGFEMKELLQGQASLVSLFCR